MYDLIADRFNSRGTQFLAEHDPSPTGLNSRGTASVGQSPTVPSFRVGSIAEDERALARFSPNIIPYICVGENASHDVAELPRLFGPRKYLHLQCGDRYENLSTKTFALFQAIASLDDGAIGMIKCDDDILPSVHHITELVKAIYRTDKDGSRIYLGKPIHIHIPHLSSHHIGKCSTPAYNKRILVPSGTFHAGPMYYLGMDLIRWITASSLPGSPGLPGLPGSSLPGLPGLPGLPSPPHFYEDVAVGIAVRRYIESCSLNRTTSDQTRRSSCDQELTEQQVVVPFITEFGVETYPSIYKNIHNIADKRKCLFIELMGGVGNQMFQVASAYGLARRNDLYIVLVYTSYYSPDGKVVSNTYKHNKSEREFLDTIFSQFPTISDAMMRTLYDSKKEMRHITFVNEPNQHVRDAFQYMPNVIGSTHTSYYLRGYFQNIKYIQQYIPEIIDLFVKGIGPTIIRNIKSRYLPTLSKSFFVHIRRGDYLNYPEAQVQLDEYYVGAIRQYQEQGAGDSPVALKPEHMYVISNDPLFCETYAPLKTWTGPRTILAPEGKCQTDKGTIGDLQSTDLPDNELTTLETLVFMALCQYGGICANSTFSWWGGFLGVYSKWGDSSTIQKRMYLPSQWITSDTAKRISMSYPGATLL